MAFSEERPKESSLAAACLSADRYSGHPCFLSKIIPTYCELSGFVHGGPSTSLILDALSTEVEQANRLLQDADLVVAMFFSAKRCLLMLAAAVRPDFQPQLERFTGTMERFG